MPQLADRLRAEVADDFGPENVAHDLGHLDRVSSLALRIAREEGGDPEVLVAAAYLHDQHRVLERERGHRVGAADAEPRVRAVLARVGFPPERERAVLEAIAHSSRYSFSGHDLGAPGVEAVVLRDADNLDAMGAIGIARAFMYGGHLGSPPWLPGVPVAETYVPGRGTSVVHHFHEKLLRLRGEMTTATAARLADERHEVMLGFLAALERELAA